MYRVKIMYILCILLKVTTTGKRAGLNVLDSHYKTKNYYIIIQNDNRYFSYL